jgi:elongator complex protein 3
MENGISAQTKEWKVLKSITPEKLEMATLALAEIRNGSKVFDAIKKHPLRGVGGGYIGKQVLVTVYNQMVESGEMLPDKKLLARIRMKPMRTQSGVTVVTVLTKPYPCPGQCVFCPTDIRMPKSYLPDEPGAMRALHHKFDPYNQVVARLEALHAVGHPTDKIELLILGGTWSAYRKDYQEWFVLQLFNALNKKEFPTLKEAQEYNETTSHRNVGLVIETRPDHINVKEVAWLREIGVTKVQLGAQSFNDEILLLNKRGHDVEATKKAVSLLRAGGFKIVLHWMPNLLGATVEKDQEDFASLWKDFCPDEIKIYPNQLLKNAELYEYWERGEFKPYTTEQLIKMLTKIKPTIPRYSRVNRVIRDIPSTNVVEGNKRTSLRMDIHKELERLGTPCQCIRCREVRGSKVDLSTIKLDDLTYSAGGAEEHFLSFVTAEDKIAGFLRLSLPQENAPDVNQIDLIDSAIIREVHVYGQSLEVGSEKDGAAQHIGLGTKLIAEAERIAKQNGFNKLAVIAAIGTRKYYGKRGFTIGESYMIKEI